MSGLDLPRKLLDKEDYLEEQKLEDSVKIRNPISHILGKKDMEMKSMRKSYYRILDKQS